MGIIDNIMNIFTLGDEADKIFDDNWLSAFDDPNLKQQYENLKPVLRDKYGADPAKFIGYLEDSNDLWFDVKSAANESGTDPNLLYIIGMQEGFGSKNMWGEEGDGGDNRVKNTFYSSTHAVDTYMDVGLDSFFNIQDVLLEKGYLKSEIKTVTKKLYTIVNEAGMYNSIGMILSKDAWRALGASTRQYEDYMENIFSNRDLNFNDLSKDQKNFWIYAAYNGGPGQAAKLLDDYGVDPISNKGIKDSAMDTKKNHIVDMGEGKTMYDFRKPKAFNQYINNIARVVGGVELMEVYNPFEYEDFMYVSPGER